MPTHVYNGTDASLQRVYEIHENKEEVDVVCSVCGAKLIVALDLESANKHKVHPGIYCSSRDPKHPWTLIELRSQHGSSFWESHFGPDVRRRTMHVIYCNNPLNPHAPDPAYANEVAAAAALGIPHSLFSYESLVNDADPERATRRVPPAADETLALYRGWMLTVDQYRQLFDALQRRHLRLINDPPSYLHCHHFPESYDVIAAHTPKSVWLPTDGNVSIDQLMHLLRPFGDHPIVLKDFVKSRKHEWNDACYIPSAADPTAVERVVKRFLELRGDDLIGGLVFREFVPLEPVGTHPKSGMPLSVEFRLFILDGAPIACLPYWDNVTYPSTDPPLDQFLDLARGVRSRFFTMDLAKTQNDQWLIIELGDAQVAALPDCADPTHFYRRLQHHWPAEGPSDV